MAARGTGATLRLVGLGDHRGDFEAFTEQRAEGGDGEIGRAEECDLHDWSAVSGTSRTRLVSPFRLAFHLRMRSWRLSGLVRSKKMMPSR